MVLYLYVLVVVETMEEIMYSAQDAHVQKGLST